MVRRGGGKRRFISPPLAIRLHTRVMAAAANNDELRSAIEGWAQTPVIVAWTDVDAPAFASELMRRWQTAADATLSVLADLGGRSGQTVQWRAMRLAWLRAIVRLVPGLVDTGDSTTWRLDDAQAAADTQVVPADPRVAVNNNSAVYSRELSASNRSGRPADLVSRAGYVGAADAMRAKGKKYCGNIHEVAADALRASRDPAYVGLYGFRGLGTLAGCTRRGYFGGRRAGGGPRAAGGDGGDGGDLEIGDDAAAPAQQPRRSSARIAAASARPLAAAAAPARPLAAAAAPARPPAAAAAPARPPAAAPARPPAAADAVADARPELRRSERQRLARLAAVVRGR